MTWIRPSSCFQSPRILKEQSPHTKVASNRCKNGQNCSSSYLTARGKQQGMQHMWRELITWSFGSRPFLRPQSRPPDTSTLQQSNFCSKISAPAVSSLFLFGAMGGEIKTASILNKQKKECIPWDYPRRTHYGGASILGIPLQNRQECRRKIHTHTLKDVYPDQQHSGYRSEESNVIHLHATWQNMNQ